MVVVDRTIIAFSQAGEAVYGLVVPSLSCCDLYGNAGGDWTGGIEHLQGQLGNICEDPMFCDLPAGNYGITHDSPCCPGHNECGLVGAGPVGCTAASVAEGPAVGGGSPLICAPNPFRAQTRIRAGAGGGSLLTIHDLLGRRVRTLLGARDASGTSGASEFLWDGRDDEGRPVVSGVYVCRLVPTAGGGPAGSDRSRVATQRVVLVR